MKLTKPALAITFATTLTLVACGGNETGQGTNEYNGNPAQPIGYNQTSNDPANDRANNRNQRNTQNDTRTNEGNRMMENNRPERGADNQTTRQDDTNYEVADKVADKVADEVPELGRVYVLTTNNNAYVAAAWDKQTNDDADVGNEELTDDTKEKITKIVKSVDNDIDNVYISTNPDFFNLADEYTNDVERGNPVEGLFQRMGNMIERVFPTDER
ncbi:YhcN/YlaJ family sporulation lipoprotein [Gracilibacillus sp. S3-1-1]|uniref:YhcN/YlaJ family sporulation lipoprotein n=1 Tax=Gracilibacillus pellucidus TaxID=3095368 RepID=A0ACC6M4B5_9BACI|nr:YhcN/YlaJ family sporulation lipoprotein [Gracilibacillus sp. S3-1-1]MDX8045662.1 YhcN/YlaJ family sporulation lipoprotein [Gracilibacillus sp. S3-1-1]